MEDQQLNQIANYSVLGFILMWCVFVVVMGVLAIGLERQRKGKVKW